MNIDPAIMGEHPDFYSHGSAQDMVLEFEGILRSHGIEIMAGSDLERICLNIVDIVEKHRNPAIRGDVSDLRRYFTESMGLTDLIRKIIRVKDHVDFHQLVPHLRLLNSGTAPQNVRTLSTDQDGNKIFELYVATLAMQCGNSILLDDPYSSKGDNPDILATFNTKRWGIACKVMHTSSPQTILDRIEDGCEQIQRSEAEIGIVMLNFKNIINHDYFWPSFDNADGSISFGAYDSIMTPSYEFDRLGYQIFGELNDLVTQTPDLFRTYPKTIGVLIFQQTGSSIIINSIPTPAILSKFFFVPTTTGIEEHQELISGCLNDKLHNR